MLPFGIGFSEVLLILVVVLLVVGPNKLPEIARTMAKGLRTARNAGRELRDAIDMEEVRDIRRSIYEPLNDWREDDPVEDAQTVAPELETLHQKPTAPASVADAEAAPVEDGDEGAPVGEGDEDAPDEDVATGPVARHPLSVVRRESAPEPAEDAKEPDEPA